MGRKVSEMQADTALSADALFYVVDGGASRKASRQTVRKGLYPAGLVFVASPDDLPAAVAGVRTLAANTAYYFTQDVDLLGDRLVCSQDTAILGSSSENCRLSSTGLTGTALITSAWSLPMRNISIQADVALDLDATANPGGAIDWSGVNFVNCGAVGTVAGYSNAIFSEGSLLNSGGWTFDGTIATIAFDTCLFQPPAGQAAIILADTLDVTRRFRMIYCAVVAASATGVDVADAAATFANNESFILDTVNFSGGGTYLDGISASSNKALIVNCVGVPNSANSAQYYMVDNAAPTSTTLQDTFYKIAGTTLPGDFVEKFTLGNNEATYVGALTAPFRVDAVASLTSSANTQTLSVRIAKNGNTLPASESRAGTGTGTTRIESIASQAVVQLSAGDVISVYVANRTAGGGTVTATNLNVIIERA